MNSSKKYHLLNLLQNTSNKTRLIICKPRERVEYHKRDPEKCLNHSRGNHQLVPNLKY